MLKFTTLSISLATVTSGAAVSPALGLLAMHFNEYPEFMVKLIVSLPSIMIIFTSFVFAKLAKYLDVKLLACIGFCLFIFGGVMPFFLDNLVLILVCRAILGVGVGFLTPLSVSLIGFLFNKNEQTKLMGLSSMFNQIGAVLTVSFSGFLASISWQYSFLIYLFAVLIFILVLIFLPRVKMGQKDKKFDKRNAKSIADILVCMFFVQVLFFSFVNNFSIIYQQENIINASFIGVLMGVNGLFGAFCSFAYPKILAIFGKKTKYLASIFYVLAFGIFSLRVDGNVLGMNAMIVLGVVGLVCNGIATGTFMPLLVSQISIRSKKVNLSTNMALGSIFLFSGQFASPLIDAILIKVLHLDGGRDAFLISFFVAIFLFLYTSKIKLKVAKKSSK